VADFKTAVFTSHAGPLRLTQQYTHLRENGNEIVLLCNCAGRDRCRRGSQSAGLACGLRADVSGAAEALRRPASVAGALAARAENRREAGCATEAARVRGHAQRWRIRCCRSPQEWLRTNRSAAHGH